MSVRDLVGAAQLYLEAVPTFGSYELMSYEDLVFYAVITAIYGRKYRRFQVSYRDFQLSIVLTSARRSFAAMRFRNRYFFFC